MVKADWSIAPAAATSERRPSARRPIRFRRLSSRLIRTRQPRRRRSISGRITTADGAPLAGVSMNLSGARSAKVITDANGNYRFKNIDTDNFYTVTPTLRNYHFGPESQSFSLLANKTDAVFTASLDATYQRQRDRHGRLLCPATLSGFPGTRAGRKWVQLLERSDTFVRC